MAEEAYLVAYNIQSAGPGTMLKAETGLGAKKEVSIGGNEYEAGSLYSQGIKSVAEAKLVEVKAGSAAEAIEVVREKYGQNAGPCRAVVKPNTNFKAVT
jgi:hypothetical protein